MRPEPDVPPAGPSTRVVARVVLVVTLLSALVYGLYLVRGVILLCGIALFLAVVLGPAVEALARRGAPRALAILAVYACALAFVVGAGSLVVPSLVSGVEAVARDAPAQVEKLRHSRTFRTYDDRYKITRALERQLAALPQRLGDAAAALRDLTVGVFGTLVQLVTVLTVTFFLLLDGPRLLAWGADRLPGGRGPPARAVTSRIYGAVSGYVAGNLAISVIAGLVSFVTLEILGVPFAGPLSVLMGVFDLLPLVGATIGAVIVGVVTLFHGFPGSTIAWSVVQVLYQQVESNVIFPVVYRRTVHVNGFVTILAVLVGASLLGILGALVAIPVAGAIQIVAVELWRAHARADEPLLTAPHPGGR